MTTEAKGESQAGLVRRAAGLAKAAFDDSAPAAQRVRAGSTVVGGAAAIVGGGLAAGDVVNNLVVGNPAFLSAIHSAAVSMGGEGLVAGAVGGLVVYGATFMCTEDESRSDYLTERTKAHNFVGKVRTGSILVAGVAAVLAAGVAGADGLGLAHAAAFDSTLFDVALIGGTAGVGMSAARLLTRRGAASPAKAPPQLGE